VQIEILIGADKNFNWCR